MANKLLEAKMGPGPLKSKSNGKSYIKRLTKEVSEPVKATSDSSTYFKRQGDIGAKYMTTLKGGTAGSNMIIKADKDLARQKLKGKPGYDKNGFPIKKMM